jgi:hypothetical protein
MPNLQTKVDIPFPAFNINYSDEIILLGSCFASNIGERLSQLKFKSITNPFGVIYNPASIANSIDLLVDGNDYTDAKLNYFNELWFSFSHHTSFSSPDKNACLGKINLVLNKSAKMIRNAGVIFLTLGTARFYRYKKTGEIVSNCHKIPAAEFEREFLEIPQIVKLLSDSFDKILQINKATKFVLTISPIRHWKDGAIENMRSKSALLMAVRELEKKYVQLYYFPVYEIFMDELRDYRFYASDMLHPSDFAVDYIWEKFVQVFFTNETMQQANEIDKLVYMLKHRPIITSTNAYKKFLYSINEKISEFQQKYPEIDFSGELQIISLAKIL